MLFAKNLHVTNAQHYHRKTELTRSNHLPHMHPRLQLVFAICRLVQFHDLDAERSNELMAGVVIATTAYTVGVSPLKEIRNGQKLVVCAV